MQLYCAKLLKLYSSSLEIPTAGVRFLQSLIQVQYTTLEIERWLMGKTLIQIWKQPK